MNKCLDCSATEDNEIIEECGYCEGSFCEKCLIESDDDYRYCKSCSRDYDLED